VLAWRGRGRDELLIRLRQLRGLGSPGPAPAPTEAAGLGDLAAFWSMGTPPLQPLAAAVAARTDLLLDQLDPVPLGVNGQPVTELLRPAYRALGAGYQASGA
jgi:hypothetical protein